MTTNQDSSEKLILEIMADAARSSEETIARAGKDAEALLKNAAAEADRERQRLLEQARAEADRQGSLILATVPVETGRLLAAHVEEHLKSVYDEVCQRLMTLDGFDYRETVIALASDAIRQMTGDRFAVRLPAVDQNIGDDGLAENIARQVGRRVGITVFRDKDIIEHGVIIEDTDGRQVWDNRLLKRLERLWPELRRQIAAHAGLMPHQRTAGDNS